MFERIIVYLCLSDLLVKIIFEIGLGQDYFLTSAKNRQWIFYILLASDYIISLPRILNLRIKINFLSMFAFLLIVMVLHGMLVGIVLGNRPFVIFNDMVPILMAAMNILRMQSYAEHSIEPDYKFLLKTVVVFSVSTVAIGLLGRAIGLSTMPSFSSLIFFCVVAVAFLKIRPVPIWVVVSFLFVTLSTLEDTNRSTILFLGLVSIAYLIQNYLHNPMKGTTILLFFTIVVGVIFLSLPETSKTYSRITGGIDFSTTTGSVGERKSEMLAVQSQLEKLGKTNQWFGLGFGGTYNVRFTHSFLTDYGHAHYSWVWFNLRFGSVGYVYLTIMMLILALNAMRGVRFQSEMGYLVGLICLFSLIYLFTYVNAIFLMVGLPFMYLARKSQLPASSNPVTSPIPISREANPPGI